MPTCHSGTHPATESRIPPHLCKRTALPHSGSGGPAILLLRFSDSAPAPARLRSAGSVRQPAVLFSPRAALTSLARLFSDDSNPCASFVTLVGRLVETQKGASPFRVAQIIILRWLRFTHPTHFRSTSSGSEYKVCSTSGFANAHPEGHGCAI